MKHTSRGSGPSVFNGFEGRVRHTLASHSGPFWATSWAWILLGFRCFACIVHSMVPRSAPGLRTLSLPPSLVHSRVLPCLSFQRFWRCGSGLPLRTNWPLHGALQPAGVSRFRMHGFLLGLNPAGVFLVYCDHAQPQWSSPKRFSVSGTSVFKGFEGRVRQTLASQSEPLKPRLWAWNLLHGVSLFRMRGPRVFGAFRAHPVGWCFAISPALPRLWY